MPRLQPRTSLPCRPPATPHHTARRVRPHAHLLCDGVRMGRELSQGGAPVLPHHALPVQLAQALVRVGLQSGAGVGEGAGRGWGRAG